MLPTNFTLINIGKIKESTITLNRFTVLCGKNGVGKSFFSKSLFLLYKTLYEYEDWIYVEIERNFRSIIETISYLIATPLKYLTLNYPNISRSLKKEIFLCVEQKDSERLLEILQEIKKINQEIENYLEKDKEQSDFLSKLMLDRGSKTIRSVKGKIKNLEKLLNSLREDSYDILRESFDNFVKLIFKRQLCRYDSNISKICLGNSYLELKDNKVIKLNCSELLETKINILFIESPFILEIFEQLGRLIARPYPFASKRRYVKYKLPYHIEDLVNQIREYEKFIDEDEKFLNKIEEIVKGKFRYIPLKEEIYFQEGEYSIHALNTASGILTFGVLYLLLQSGAFDENTILIFEEPETNLHPEWQIKIVEVLKALMEEIGVQIFLTTHSPFIVKALEVTALEDKNFKKSLSINLIYEDGKTVCDFEESIEKIYDQLLGPFSTLMFKGWFYE